MKNIDTDKVILDFIINNKDSKDVMTNSIYGLDEDTVLRFSLVNKGECIETDANEVPNSNNDGWHYNGSNTYDYMYFIIYNKLLSVTFINDIEYGVPRALIVNLYPNANNYTIQTKKGHRSKPYVKFIDQTGKSVNTFDFEVPREDLSDFDGLAITDIINSITSEELINRYNQHNPNKPFIKQINN